MAADCAEEIKFLVRASQSSESLLRKLDITSQLEDNCNHLIQELFGIDPSGEVEDMVDEEVAEDIDCTAKAEVDDDEQEVIIDYQDLDDEDNKMNNLCLAAGLPGKVFDKAEEIYLSEVENLGDDHEEYNLVLEGYGSGGALAQYLGVKLASREVEKVISLDGTGIKNLTEFRGNEFLGYQQGVFDYLNYTLKENYRMNDLFVELIQDSIKNWPVYLRR